MTISGPRLDAAVDLSSLLAAGLTAKPDDTAIVSLATEWTWRDLEATSTSLARNLLSFGLKPGDRVASLMPNRTAQILYYVACIKAGLIAVPLNYRYMPPEIDHALEVSGAVAMVAHAERDADLAKSRLVPDLPLGVIGFEATDSREGTLGSLIEQESTDVVLPTLSPENPVAVFFTSGSTGKPKGVTHSVSSMGWVLATAITGFEVNAQDRVLPACSGSHVGAYVLALSSLAAGATVCVTRTLDPEELLEVCRKQRPTIMAALPAPLMALVRDHGAMHEDFTSLRYCLSGGDKVSATLDREFKELVGQDIREDYGMTEIGLTHMNSPSGLNKLGSVGTLSPGIEASIRSDSGSELPTGQAGRQWIRSPGNMIGYWNNPEATDETIQDGWLDTGDLMEVDDDGYFWFRGRRKQIIVHDGSNISPQEVEQAVMEHAAVALAGVVGVHSLVHGENVRAYVALKPEATKIPAQELIAFARERVGYKAPEEIIFVDDLPLTATGKVDRVTLKGWMSDQQEATQSAD